MLSSKTIQSIRDKNDDFKEYSSCSPFFNYSKFPFSKVVTLKFQRESSEVFFKTSLSEKEFDTVEITKKEFP